MKAHRGVGVLVRSFLPSALDRVLRLGPLLQGKNPGTIEQEAGSAPEPFRTGFCRRENLFPPPGFEPRTVQPVVSRYTD